MAATNDAWVMYMILQLYLGFEADKPELAKMPFPKNNAPLKLTKRDAEYFDYIYTRLIEEKVINAIKHVENGSLGFYKYYLSSFGKPTHDKREVLNEMVEELGISKKDGVRLISLILWAHDNGYLQACKEFVSMHNKGVITEKEEVVSKFDDIVKYTLVGGLFGEFYQIKKRIDAIENEAVEVSASEVSDDILDLF